MIRHLQAVDYAARTKVFHREHVEHVTFNFTLENQIHRGGQYFNDKYVGTFTLHSPIPFYLCLLQSGSLESRGFGGKYLWFLLHAAASHAFTKGISLGGVYEDKWAVFLIILTSQVHWAASEVSVL